MIPYSRHDIDEKDIEAVVKVLRSDWLTTGPTIALFEQALAEKTDGGISVAVSSGTAALHCAMYALGVGPGDEVIVPAMTFAATANAVVFQGGTPVFVDVEPGTLLIDPAAVEAAITTRTRAVVAVDYAGQPCEYDVLRGIADRYHVALVADACHSLGGRYNKRPVGSLADLNTFSFHPVKHITTGEGGAVTTHDQQLASHMRTFRNHGITSDHIERASKGSWFYEMVDLGYNYRISDFQCALGISQLQKLDLWVTRRREIASRYEEYMAEISGISPLSVRPECYHAYHLYVVRLNAEILGRNRAEVFRDLRDAGIGVNVHYVPVHLHPYYRDRFGTSAGLCPVAEEAYEEIISLPVHSRMTDHDLEFIVQAVKNVIQK